MDKTNFSQWLAPAVTGLSRAVVATSGKTRNGAVLHPKLDLEHWSAVADGKHNLTTDLCHWRGHFYLVHSSSPWHIASSDSKLVVWRSTDAKTWEIVAEFKMPDGDIRD